MNELIKLHKEVFDVEPVIIGLHWDDLDDRLFDAIENNTPYDETKELSAAELKAFNKSELVF
jgi:hypothetical protein